MDSTQNAALESKSDFDSKLQFGNAEGRPDSNLSHGTDAETRPDSKLSYSKDQADGESRLPSFVENLKKTRKYSFLVLAIIIMAILTDISSSSGIALALLGGMAKHNCTDPADPGKQDTSS